MNTQAADRMMDKAMDLDGDALDSVQDTIGIETTEIMPGVFYDMKMGHSLDDALENNAVTIEQYRLYIQYLQ